MRLLQIGLFTTASLAGWATSAHAVDFDIGGDTYRVIEGNPSTFILKDGTGSGLQAGEGRVKVAFNKRQDSFAEDADSTQSLHFALDDGGLLRIDNFCKSNDRFDTFFDCYVLTFERQGDTLYVAQGLSSDPASFVDITSYFATIDASKDIFMQIDTHAHENPMHVLAWNKIVGPFEEAEAVYDSERDEKDSNFGYTREGYTRVLTLGSGTVFTAKLGAPVFVHDD